MRIAAIAVAFAVSTTPVQLRAGNLFSIDDVLKIADVSEPALSSDGRWLAYTVTESNLQRDEQQSDLWRVGFDGRGRVRLTQTEASSEWRPQWSADGRQLAFLSDRPQGSESEPKPQVWVMPRAGGEPQRLTALAQGVEDFVWSPDGKQLALIAYDPEEVASGSARTPAPIVIDRYQFREDGRGYLGNRRSHLYLYTIADGRLDQLTSGAHDEQLPAWSPDGKLIAYVSKRGADPDRHLNFDIYLIEARAGGSERQLTTFPGSDLDPYWESRPAWSPDSRRIAYLQSGEDKWIYYAPWQLAVIEVATGRASQPALIDRCFSKPRWSPDGRSVHALIEQSRVTHLSRIDLASGKVQALTQGARFDYDFDVSASGRIVVLGGDDARPYEISAVEKGGLRPLSDHNDWLRDRQLAKVAAIHFDSADGTAIEGMLVRPAGYEPGRRYPTLLRLHGGPVYQFSHEFMADWQVYAAQGYAVVAVNPRGSSGRGFDFSRAIYADWGRLDVEDALAAVDHVVAMGIADPKRLGVGGWSYGSILSNAVIARDTRFAAAVSGAGASNMYALYGHDQYIREYELELGLPWRDRAAYDRASFPFLHADRIRTPTLFQCAELDANVPCLGAEQMFQALRSLNVPTRLVIYPSEHHGLSVPSYLRDRLQRTLDWYDRYLRAPLP
jgi:dipeptidyl aminopeptidase/acylaminoacyl peptidase